MFFYPNLGTRNAKNPIVPFNVPKCNQKTAKLKKKLMSFKWFLRVLKRGQGKNADVSKK